MRAACAVISAFLLAGMLSPGRSWEPTGENVQAQLWPALWPWPDPLHSWGFILATFGLCVLLLRRAVAGRGPSRLAWSAALVAGLAVLIQPFAGYSVRLMLAPGQAARLPSSWGGPQSLHLDKLSEDLWVHAERAGGVREKSRSIQWRERIHEGALSLAWVDRAGSGLDLYRVRAVDGAGRSELRSMPVGTPATLDGASFVILAYSPEVESFGPGARVEYRSAAEREPERFWIFQKFPGFDRAHRKGSRWSFELLAAEPGSLAVLEAGWVAACWAFALSVLLAAGAGVWHLRRRYGS
jgi:hypothetical protein